MGGLIPMGYNAKDRSLIVDKGEARIIGTIFRLYCDLKNVRLVHAELDRLRLKDQALPGNNRKDHRRPAVQPRAHLPDPCEPDLCRRDRT